MASDIVVVETRSNFQAQETHIVYILINAAMVGLVKIGMTKDLNGRLKELNRPSGVPLPFDVFYAARVQNMKNVEALDASGIY